MCCSTRRNLIRFPNSTSCFPVLRGADFFAFAFFQTIPSAEVNMDIGPAKAALASKPAATTSPRTL
jgi:hypothetical protein